MRKKFFVISVPRVNGVLKYLKFFLCDGGAADLADKFLCLSAKHRTGNDLQIS
jgi:hypothetical protein